MSQAAPPIDWFRSIAPYIRSHRDRTVVIYIGSGALDHPGLVHLVHDIALLQVIGIRPVLVHATRDGIEQALAERGLESHLHEGIRITDLDALHTVSDVVGRQRAQLERRLSMGLPNSPMRGARLRVISGNFVTARPVGIVDGVDYLFTGAVRRVDVQGISDALDTEAVVLLSPLGYSAAGELFNLDAEELATAAAVSLGADKLIMLHRGGGLQGSDGIPVRQCTVAEARALELADTALAATRDVACLACDHGVERVHLIDLEIDGALLTELFTVDGVGTLISEQGFERARTATLEDIGGVIELVRPLEESGVLVRRSRERLEQEISNFRVLERDGCIIACAALYPFPDADCGEIACIATDSNYRREGRGGQLLQQLLAEASDHGFERVFVLTTQTTHWFIEQGFEEVGLDTLPSEKQALYNLQRNSKVLELRFNG